VRRDVHDHGDEIVKVIFLDFDGVVVCREKIYGRLEDHNKWARNAQPEPVQQLNRIIRETGAKVVVSSTWRMHHDIPELDGTLRRSGFEGEIIGTTPVFHKERGVEIRAWLESHPEVEDWVVLDDDSDRGDITFYRWILIKDGLNQGGLLASHADQAISVLNAKREWRFLKCR
jgi:hypothetical protein